MCCMQLKWERTAWKLRNTVVSMLLGNELEICPLPLSHWPQERENGEMDGWYPGVEIQPGSFIWSGLLSNRTQKWNHNFKMTELSVLYENTKFFNNQNYCACVRIQ